MLGPIGRNISPSRSRQARVEKGAASTVRSQHGRRRMPRCKKRVHAPCQIADARPQIGINTNTLPPSRLAVEQIALGNLDSIHFLKTDCLSGKLNPIPVINLGSAHLVLNGSNGRSVRINAKLDKIRNPIEAELPAHQVHPTLRALALRTRIAPHVDPLVEEVTPKRVDTVVPHLLNMNEGPLTLTERKVLQSRERQQVFVVIHGYTEGLM